MKTPASCVSIVVLISVLMSACGSSQASRDACMVLSAADVPSELSEVSKSAGLDVMKDILPGNQDVHTDLVDGQHASFFTPHMKSMLICNSWVYQSEESAGRAFHAMLPGLTGDSVDMPPLGNESQAIASAGKENYLVEIAWRHRNTVINILWFSRQAAPADEQLRMTNETQRLAQLVQAHLEGKEK